MSSPPRCCGLPFVGFRLQTVHEKGKKHRKERTVFLFFFGRREAHWTSQRRRRGPLRKKEDVYRPLSPTSSQQTVLHGWTRQRPHWAPLDAPQWGTLWFSSNETRWRLRGIPNARKVGETKEEEEDESEIESENNEVARADALSLTTFNVFFYFFLGILLSRTFTVSIDLTDKVIIHQIEFFFFLW